MGKVLELQLQHQFLQYSGVISFRVDWFDLFAVQGTPKMSAGEESAREHTSPTHFLGTHGVSLWECGDAKPSQGPWEPGALGAPLILGGLETA